MTALHTVVAVIPVAETADRVIAAYRTLPLREPTKLIGLHVSPIAIQYGLAGDMAIASYVEAQIEMAADEREKAGAAFKAACEREGIASEWRVEQSLDALVSTRCGVLARVADLVLFPATAEGQSLGRHQIEQLVFTSGRPVLAIPEGWAGSSLGEVILVAWDGGREAARAVFDALPFLQRAKSVRIVSVEGRMAEPTRQFTPGDDLAAALQRHGVAAESVAFESRQRSVREALETQALDTGADLVVMGCYGHSRLREMVLGGVSRDVLKHLPFPVLLSN